MRSSVSRKRILELLAFIASLSFSYPTFAQSCSSASVDEQQSQIPSSCHGSNVHEIARTTKRFDKTSSVACQYYGYYGSTRNESQTVGSDGECGPTPANTQPICPAWVGSAFATGMGQWQVELRTNTYVGPGCSTGVDYTTDISIATEGCNGPTCCSSAAAGACTEAGGLFDNCVCGFSPIIISLHDAAPDLTNAEGGVLFDLLANGHRKQTSWTKAGESDAFLALDRDGNGRIDNGKELFGGTTDQPSIEGRNGFRALSALDNNNDKRIDARDSIYAALRLWTDSNHDGLSELSELQSLEQVGIISINLAYKTLSRRDRYGNVLRYAAQIERRLGSRTFTRTAYDVFLIGQ